MPILADEMDILLELKNQLALNGVYRFATMRQISNHIQVNCPIHKDGQERKPSCGITTSQIKYSDGRVVKPGTVHCFTCGYTASLNEMISTLFGKDDRTILSGEQDKTIRISDFPPIQKLIYKTKERFGSRRLSEEERKRFYLDVNK